MKNFEQINKKETKVFDIKTFDKLKAECRQKKVGRLDTYSPDSVLVSRFVNEYTQSYLLEYDPKQPIKKGDDRLRSREIEYSMHNNPFVIKQTILNRDFDGRNRIEQKIDDYFTYIEVYYHNGNIEKKGISSVFGFSVGMWYEYDTMGNVIKETNDDEGFELTFEDVVKFCKKKGMDNLLWGQREYGRIETQIAKDYSSKIWVIHYYDYKIKKYHHYELDGKTGKVIEEKLNIQPPSPGSDIIE